MDSGTSPRNSENHSGRDGWLWVVPHGEDYFAWDLARPQVDHNASRGRGRGSGGSGSGSGRAGNGIDHVGGLWVLLLR